jgi:hypothetical protein
MSSFAKAKLSFVEAKMKTPPASEDTGGVFHAFTSFEVAALGKTNFEISFSFRLSQTVFSGLACGSRGFGTLVPLQPF